MEEFRKILRDDETIFRIRTAHKTYDKTKWTYEIMFSFSGDFAKTKEEQGKWAVSILNQSLSES